MDIPYIKRSLEKVVLNLTNEYPVILITGPRQVGKTTMLKKLMENTDRSYVSLDDLNERELAINDPAMFLQIHKPPILIDEVQYAPELFTYIKLSVDKNQNPGDFWLTATQMFKLMEGVRESLAGRVAILRLNTLSQNEIYAQLENQPFSLDLELLLQREKKIDSIDVNETYRRIYTGSMPAIVTGKYTDKNIFYSSYIDTYLERDVQKLLPTIDTLEFLKFITSLAARCGQIVNNAQIARECDINEVTLKKWSNVLQKLGIIFYLHPYSNNTLKRTIKAPKVYFFDTGLVSYLTKWSSSETLESGAMNGAILENYCISEIIKSFDNSGKESFVYYYRDKDMKEIDVIIEADGTLYPIEIKKTAMPNIQLTNVFNVLDKSNMKRGNGAIICMKDKLSAFDNKNYIIPISLI